MPGGKLALAGVDVAIVEQRASQKLGGSRAGGLHSGTVEIPDQRGMATAMITHRHRVRMLRVAGDRGAVGGGHWRCAVSAL
jgi:2-polyprenyl-6-methoxyphenol hydroxylase-like FAD-dependent oxidoreductase